MMRKLTHQEIVARQEENPRPSIPLTVILNDIRSLYNVGSIFRTADGAGIEKIWLCGITGFPPQREISKTALGAEARVPWEYVKEVFEVVLKLKKKGYQIVTLEHTDESLDYYLFEPRQPVCLILGNEIEGVNEKLLPLCDKAIEIKMTGIKNSLNVSVAFGIAAYHICHTLRHTLPV